MASELEQEPEEQEDSGPSILEVLTRIRDFGGKAVIEIGNEFGQAYQDKGVAGMALEAAALPGEITRGLIRGINQGGLYDALGVAGKLLNAIPKAIVPGTGENAAVGSGIAWIANPFNWPKALDKAVDFGESEIERYGRVVSDPLGEAERHPLGTLEALVTLGAGPAMGIRKGLVRAGTAIETDTFAAAAEKIGGQLGAKAAKLRDEMADAGVMVTDEQAIDLVIAGDKEVQVLRRSALEPAIATPGTTGKLQPIAGPAPMPHGREGRWIREAGDKGQMAYQELRYGQNLENLVKRLVPQHTRDVFDGLDSDAKSGLSQVLARMDKLGDEYRYGGILRAGEVDSTDMVLGDMLADGRVVGRETFPGSNVSQAYRFVHADDARALHERLLREHPEAEEILEAFLAEKEAPIVTYQGLRLPSFSRKRLKEQYGVKGLEQEEADLASALFRRAFGPDAKYPADQMWQFNWVPESSAHGTGLGSRFRNSLKTWRAPSRRHKTGWVSEEGIDLDLGVSLSKARTDLAVEDIRNNTSRSIISILAEPLTEADRAALKAGKQLEGYQVLSKTGLYGESAKFRGFVERNKNWFDEMGIDVPEVMDATYLAGGKGYKIPAQIADDLGAWYKPELLSVHTKRNEMFKKFDQYAGDFLRAPLTFWLSKPSTANRNFISQTFTFAPKVIRDFYRGLFQSIPAARFEDLPWQALVSDFAAVGRMHGGKIRREMPPEMLGSTFLQEMEVGPVSRAAALPLRAFGFNYHDVSFKRLATEAVLDAQAKSAWHGAVRRKLTGGVSKEEFIRRWRANVPPEIEALAWREMDTWGAFDYDNVPELIDKIRSSTVGRALIPFPTYISKLLGNTYTEIGLTPHGFYKNVKAASTGKSKAERVNALANLATGATVAGLAFNAADEIGNLARELSDPETRALAEEVEELSGTELSEKDLFPATERKFGRVKFPMSEQTKELIGLAEDEALWVRMYDMPFIGDAMAYKAIAGKDATVAGYLNDRVAMGPMTTFLEIMLGLSDDYNKSYSTATRLGKLASDVTPFGNELELARKMLDPQKRELSQPGAPAWRDFLSGLGDRFPVFSTLQDPKMSRDLGVQTYNQAETLGAYFLINARKLSESEREAAISLLAIQQATEMRKEITDDALRPHILKIIDENGKTAIGEARKAVRASDPEVRRQLRMTVNAARIIQAYRFGGIESATATFEKLMDEQDKAGMLDKAMFESAKDVLQKQIILEEEGLKGHVLHEAPKRQRAKILSALEGE